MAMRCLPVVAALAFLFVSGASASRPASLRVLFVGNSLTQTNDLPAQVARLAAASKRAFAYRTVVFGGFNLEDQWNEGEARAALHTGDFDVVVVQQGPSALPQSQVDLAKWASIWADEARSSGTRLALWTVWPEAWRQGALTDVIASYRNAAVAAHADLYPAGEAWLYAWQCLPSLALYGPDGFHPSELGTYAAALVVYGGLFKAPVRTIAAGKPGLEAKTVRLLQWSAAKALGRKPHAAARCGR
jgi:hypothetical protein